jgi:uncharacterized membrane protein
MLLFYGWNVVIGPWRGPRLLLNLSLAWAPYAFALVTVWFFRRNPERRLRLWLPIFLWLLFFPNAPYLVTDWLYLPGWTRELWYGIGLMITFSMCGLMLAVVSLYLVHCVVDAAYGRAAGWCVAIVSIGLSGVGIFLGRFLRLNSWDVFTHPERLVEQLFTRAESGRENLRFLAFSGTASLLLVLWYALLLSLRRAPAGPEERLSAR